MKVKIKHIFNKIRTSFVTYVVTNRLFISYVLFSILITSLTRYYTLGEFFYYRSFIMDLSVILMFGSLVYFVKPKKQFNFFFILLVIWTTIAIINTIYYIFYTSFASLGELATLGQTETVMDSIFERLSLTNFIYIVFPLIFLLIHKKLKKSPYYYYISKIEKSKKMFITTLTMGLIFMGFILINSTPTDYSRLSKQWNRVSNVDRFGILFYQGNDIVQTLTPRISTLFGYEEAALQFNEYFNNLGDSKTNKYTEALKGFNIVFVHMESVQTFLMDLEFNGELVLPNTKKLAEEGMYFNNFHPQISTGTSSDTEFTILTSMMPALSGTVFVSYYNRNYNTLPKILGNEGYHSFSMHGNNFSMWNRANAHPALGYKEFFFEESFRFEEEDIINLGISDHLFFEQSLNYLLDIETKYPNYMGTIITLTNHSKFPDVSMYKDFDLKHYQDGEEYDFLSEKAIGKYVKSSHYADYALGYFMDEIRNSEHFDNTLFVFYGDHDAKFSLKSINYLFNYDPLTGELKEDGDDTYIEYDSFDHEMNKKTPLILWTKNKEAKKLIKGEVDYPMGAIDIHPTLLNLLGVSNKYVFGNDIFNVKEDNYIMFPNGNFLTNSIYYNASIGEYKILKENVVLDNDYVTDIIEKVEEKLQISNSIILYDLLEREVFNK